MPLGHFCCNDAVASIGSLVLGLTKGNPLCGDVATSTFALAPWVWHEPGLAGRCGGCRDDMRVLGCPCTKPDATKSLLRGDLGRLGSLNSAWTPGQWGYRRLDSSLEERQTQPADSRIPLFLDAIGVQARDLPCSV